MLCAVLTRSATSASLQTHRLQPARLLCPWDSPGKNTGVDYHALLQGNLPNPRVEPRSPTLQAASLPSEPPGEPDTAVRINDSPWPTVQVGESIELDNKAKCLSAQSVF